VTTSPTPSDLIAERIRDLRKARGLTVAELAARCAAAGMPRLTAQTLYKLEAQRSTRQRLIAVDELLILAYVLDVAPVHLIAGLDDDVPLPFPDWSVTARGARMWIRGMAPVEGGDKKLYAATVPPSEENTRWFRIDDVTSYEQVAAALEGLKAFVSLQEQQERDAAAPVSQDDHGSQLPNLE
jgi:transcriptional regulator with XRE-family HTH domain